MTQTLVQATGRRKASVARVRLRDGSGAVTLNGKPLEQFFPVMATRMRVMEPLQITNMVGRYDLEATLHGGGTTGQSDALRLGIARALIVLDPDLRPTLKAAGMLSRDDRVVESKKYGLRKARRAPQYTKR
jgi:small subunit ribosomal protein S9